MQTSKFALAALAALSTALSVWAGPYDAALLRGRTLEGSAFYAPGAKMTFELTLTHAENIPTDSYFIKWERTGDDGKRESGKVPADSTKPLIIETSLKVPGFVRIYAELVDEDGKTYYKDETKFRGDACKVFFDGGAGVEPEKLQGIPEPADFDAFWAKQKARLAATPLSAVRKEVPNDVARVYAVEVTCAGVRPVTGYLSIPKDASATKKYPCRLEAHGYGIWAPYKPPKTPRTDEIVLNINAHGVRLAEFGADEAYYKAIRWEMQSNGYGHAFDPKQNADPEIAYFNGMALRVMRALEYLKSLPEWNGRDLIVSGGSQGGLQTIWGAALDGDVTRAESDITWCCDMGGTALGRNRGNWYVPWVPALGYYDPINMVKRIPKTCTTIIPRAGLGDYTCPPSGLAILYNNIPGPKKITWVQGSTHLYIPPQPNDTYTCSANMPSPDLN